MANFDLRIKALAFAIILIIAFALLLMVYHTHNGHAIERYEDAPFRDMYQQYDDAAYDKYIVNLSPNQFGVYLINLDRSPARLRKFTRFYESTDLGKVKAFERVAAVDGKSINVKSYVSSDAWDDIQDIQWFGFRTKHNQLTIGAVGCYLSHLKVYKAIRDSNYDYGIVFEDDVKFVHPDVYKRIRVAMSNVPDDWDILLLGCVCHVCNKYADYQDLKHFFLMHAYIIKKNGANKILMHLEHMPIRQQIDSELSTLASAGKVKILCLNKGIVLQDNATNTTTIQTPMRIIDGVNPFDIPLD